MISHLTSVLTALTLGGAVIGGGFKAISKLARIADSVERLSASMEAVAARIGDHETRLSRLESRPPTPPWR